MNIWALDKDISIKHLLLMLSEEYGQGTLDMLETDDDNYRAVRIANLKDSEASLYVFTYGQDEGHYGVHIEYPDLVETAYNNTLEIYDNLSFDMLEDLIQSHLGIMACSKVISLRGW